MNVFAKLECGKYKYKMINKYNCIILRIMLSNINTVLFFFNIKSTVIIIDLFANLPFFQMRQLLELQLVEKAATVILSS